MRRTFVLSHNHPFTATLIGLIDLVRNKGDGVRLDDSDRLDGRTCLVTGASSGLGKATAIELARRGARVLMACRGGIPEAGQDVERMSHSRAVEMLAVDLAELASIHRLCDQLRDRKERLDIVVLNAGVMPRRSQRTRDGFERMFQVNYLANVLLAERLLGDGVIANRAFAQSGGGGRHPRIILVSSDSHRSAKPLDFRTFGDYVEYGMATGMAHYGHTKLALCTFAVELGRRLRDEHGVGVAVHSLCPGPVASNIAREAPGWVTPPLRLVMRLFFSTPEVAARPVVYLACARALEGETGRYMHGMRFKELAEMARDPARGAALWEASQALLRRADRAHA
jgi:NAD(P)-dependent dehydrogenase (short-subunit alcohol dehydrogenase family)